MTHPGPLCATFARALHSSEPPAHEIVTASHMRWCTKQRTSRDTAGNRLSCALRGDTGCAQSTAPKKSGIMRCCRSGGPITYLLYPLSLSLSALRPDGGAAGRSMEPADLEAIIKHLQADPVVRVRPYTLIPQLQPCKQILW